MSSFGPVLSYKFRSNARSKDQRASARKKVDADAWIRNGFAIRPCQIVDLSDTGVQIRFSTAQAVSSTFTFLMSRNSGSGRDARVKWRRGTQIGAEFI
ncbi:MAG: hypothetical protein QOH67_2275 [Hyphomicrobiales bacterium]|nr:hypothetical protein [Hyphomicrobiales bacterium]